MIMAKLNYMIMTKLTTCLWQN